MKAGKSLPQIAAQIQEEQKQKRDFVLPTPMLRYEYNKENGGVLRFNPGPGELALVPTAHCMRQICERAQIPTKYVERMLTEGGGQLFADNVNWWLQNKPERRMLRTLCNGSKVARAFLSDSYRPLDNADLAAAILPRLAEAGCEVLSAEITETRLYIQAATPRIQLDIKALMKERGITDIHPANKEDWPSDIVQAGATISNSEVGFGSLRVEPMIHRLRCYNALIVAESIRKYHVGKRVEGDVESASELFSDETRKLDDQAFWSKTIDIVDAVFNLDRFTSIAEKFAATGAVTLKNPSDAVEEVAQRFLFTEAEKASVFDKLISGNDGSLFGLINAVTAASGEVEDYDRAVELERVGGQILELPQETWTQPVKYNPQKIARRIARGQAIARGEVA